LNIAFGLKAHSGWAALIVLGIDKGELLVVDRRRIELVDEEWHKQPYHAAEELPTNEARRVVEEGVKSAYLISRKEIAAAVKRAEKLGHRIIGCGVLMGQSMPDWTVEQILAVHFRMHKAEGVLFREALAQAAIENKVRLVRVPEKELSEFALKSLGRTADKLEAKIAELGKSVGAPWGRDQKDSAMAAMIALRKNN
jgi:hypothetical protein